MFKSLVLAGLLASAGFTSFAQPMMGQGAARSPMMGASGAMQPNGPISMRGKMDSSRWEAMMAKRSAHLKAKLKITSEQEGAWSAFTATMTPVATMEFKRLDRAEMDKLTTPERIDKMHALRTQRMADINAAMDKREDATKTLYAALTAEQKKVFDTEHAQMDAYHGRAHHGYGGMRAGSRGNPAQPATK